MNYVFDSCAILAHLRDEEGGTFLYQLLSDSSAACFIHSINLCEVYYYSVRVYGPQLAREALLRLSTDGLHERSDMDQGLWTRAGEIKSRGRISLADCFCPALAERMNAQLVTSDHKEFDPIMPLGLCPIVFIR